MFTGHWRMPAKSMIGLQLDNKIMLPFNLLRAETEGRDRRHTRKERLLKNWQKNRATEFNIPSETDNLIITDI